MNDAYALLSRLCQFWKSRYQHQYPAPTAVATWISLHGPTVHRRSRPTRHSALAKTEVSIQHEVRGSRSTMIAIKQKDKRHNHQLHRTCAKICSIWSPIALPPFPYDALLHTVSRNSYNVAICSPVHRRKEKGRQRNKSVIHVNTKFDASASIIDCKCSNKYNNAAAAKLQ